MDLSNMLTDYHDKIVDIWVHGLLSDRSSRYADENESDLRPLVNRAAHAFKSALVEDQWADLRHFINFIARRRLEGGFKLSEVQRAFELYRQTLIPFLLNHVPPRDLNSDLLRLHHCLVSTVTQFSEYFQNLHEQFLRNQARYLEDEISKRTQELAESERKYRILVEDINDGYFVLVQGRVVFANNAFSKMHGYQLQEVLGAHYLDFVAPESRDEMQFAYDQSRWQPRSASRVEYLRLHRDGRRLATEIMAKISAYSGQIANLGICRDVSQRAELERKTIEAEKLNALAQLAASLAHEIHNPLTAIQMNVQMLAENLGSQPRYQKLVDTTLREIQSIQRSVMEMMDLTTSFRLKYEWVDLRDLLKGCLDMIRQRMKLQGVTASMRLDSKLRALFADAQRMEQALVNLLFNAIEALPRGGRIFLTTRAVRIEGKDWVEIKVADNGPGIPKEILPYVFDPFFSQKIRGMGLGLQNVKKIVESHGGAVIVTPRRPEGVCFCLRLPESRDVP